MDPNFEIWMYRGAITILLTVVGIGIRIAYVGLQKRLKEMSDKLEALNTTDAVREEHLKTLNALVDETRKRADDAHKRIDKVERIQLLYPTCRRVAAPEINE